MMRGVRANNPHCPDNALFVFSGIAPAPRPLPPSMPVIDPANSAPEPGRRALPDLRPLINTALRAADPSRAVETVDLRVHTGPIALLNVGKASLAMARAAHAQLGDRVTHSFSTTLTEHAADRFWSSLPGPVFACDHPLPTERNVHASRELVHWLASLPLDASVLVMLSGGASAHLCLPADGVTLNEIVAMTNALQRAGADIHDLNCVRRHCERLKGGRLALLAQPRRVFSYILSDVIGDPLHDIGSGPTVADPTTFAQANAVIRRYNLSQVAPSIAACVAAGEQGLHPENPQNDSAFVTPPVPRIIASNRVVLTAIKRALTSRSITLATTLEGLQGSASSVAGHLGDAARAGRAVHAAPFAVLAGGEWTVDVQHASGSGGPSQELALWLASTLTLDRPWAALAFSTDGRDGPTDHAGGIVTHQTTRLARERGIDIRDALARHDSTTALGALGCLVTTGATGTNLNHIAVIAVG